MNGAAVVAEGLVRHFGDVRAVDGIDLSVAKGEIYGFLGPNGAGKTTLIRMFTTLLEPTGGAAYVAGLDVVDKAQEVRLRIGAALQEAALDNRQTGHELLRLQGRLYGLTRAEIDQRLRELSPLIDFGAAMDRLIGTYSGGMKRRLDLAAALIHNPSVLFLDEPTSGLDPVSRVRVWEEVRRINQEDGVTIFLTTQYLEEADELADRVGIISHGKLAVEGPPAELKRSIGNDVIIVTIAGPDVGGDLEGAKLALLGIDGIKRVDNRGVELTIAVENGASSIGNVALALAQAGVSVREITLRTPTLDDVFMQVTGARMSPEDESEELET